MSTVREFCRRILESGDLAAKLLPPVGPGGEPLDDEVPGLPLVIDVPARGPDLTMGRGVAPLPGLHQLAPVAARRVCLDRFAHHELMAVELFAWALLTWPEMPRGLRRGFLHVLAEEQLHLRLYLERLRGLGGELGESGLSGYLWRHVPAIRASPHGVLSFLCAMGLTFEQANLDFSLLYAGALRHAGDELSAAIVAQVHADEIGHVRLAVEWLRRLKAEGESDAQAYVRAVPFPLTAARAKGHRFDAEARVRAGLDDDFVEHVRRARPYGKLRRG